MWTYRSLQAEKERVEKLALTAVMVDTVPYLRLLTSYQEALLKVERLEKKWEAQRTEGSHE